MAAYFRHECSVCGATATSSNKRGEWWKHADNQARDHKVADVVVAKLGEAA